MDAAAGQQSLNNALAAALNDVPLHETLRFNDGGALLCLAIRENGRGNAPVGTAFSTPWDGSPSDYKTAALPTELRWQPFILGQYRRLRPA